MTLGSVLMGRVAKLPPAHTHDVSVERDLTAKMPDGVALLADRWYPTDPGTSAPPTILLRSPYGRRQLGMIGRLFAERGYQVLLQSCRGTFGSAGDWVPMRNEQADGRATLEWIAAQPWFDGRLVTFGPSYLGLTQWAVAEDAPDFVKAMALNNTASNFRDAIVYPGGSFALETALTWLYQLAHQELRPGLVLRSQLRAAKVVASASSVLPVAKSDSAAIDHPVPYYQDWLVHETPGDTWWDPINFGRRLDQVPPATLVGGWYDLFLPDQVADYEALRRAGRPARLTIGPWTHSSARGMAEALRDGLDWFGEQLGDRHASDARAPVKVFVMGSGTWREFSHWPPTAETQRWYLGRGGTLGSTNPGDSPPDRFHYNPADPTPGLGGPSLNFRSAGRKDQRKRERRRDVLTYTSGVMAAELTVIGPLTATLYFRSSLEHTDFFVRLCDVSPQGKSTNLSDGIVRLTPGAVTKDDDGTFRLEISLWPTANTFAPGHRIRLQVSSGAHPLFARNTGTGEPLASATKLRSADQEVLHDGDHPSSIALPVVQLFT
ncbi:MAG TPA: CocE/NonD family hydrolase [Acidimicrobiales bacterium]|nr:CocE/NonD family hydrolase [Acidimicrobiales bacterium]